MNTTRGIYADGRYVGELHAKSAGGGAGGSVSYCFFIICLLSLLILVRLKSKFIAGFTLKE